MERGWIGRALTMSLVGGAGAALLLAAGWRGRAQAGYPLAGEPAVRLAAETADAPDLRDLPGLKPGEALLFNGWGITPAGAPVLTTDLPLKMALSPSQAFAMSPSPLPTEVTLQNFVDVVTTHDNAGAWRNPSTVSR